MVTWLVLTLIFWNYYFRTAPPESNTASVCKFSWCLLLNCLVILLPRSWFCKKKEGMYFILCVLINGQTDCYEQFFNKNRISIMRGLVLGNMPVLNAYTWAICLWKSLSLEAPSNSKLFWNVFLKISYLKVS